MAVDGDQRGILHRGHAEGPRLIDEQRKRNLVQPANKMAWHFDEAAVADRLRHCCPAYASMARQIPWRHGNASPLTAASHCRYTDNNRQYTDELQAQEYSLVIASEAKQSSTAATFWMLPRGACHRAGHFGPNPLAPRNDEAQRRTPCPNIPKPLSPARSGRSPAPSFWNRCVTDARCTSMASASRTSPRIRRSAMPRLRWRSFTTRCTTRPGTTCSPRRPTPARVATPTNSSRPRIRAKR